MGDVRYCNYHDPDWCKKYDGMRNFNLRTRIEGNTIYVEQHVKMLKFEKAPFGLFRHRNVDGWEAISFFVLVKAREQSLREFLESFGFQLAE